jgi:hypothetical protein
MSKKSNRTTQKRDLLDWFLKSTTASSKPTFAQIFLEKKWHSLERASH